MEQFIQLANDPVVREFAERAVGYGLSKVVGAGFIGARQFVREKFRTAPEVVQRAAEQNAESFAELLADKLVAKVNVEPATREVINDALSTPTGYLALQEAWEVAAEVDDEFTRENLAELVARRLTAQSPTRVQSATRIAARALVYLSEPQLRLMAFLTIVQGLCPDTIVSDQAEWTNAVIIWLRRVESLVVAPDFRDLNLIASAGLVDVMPRLVGYNLNGAFTNADGFVPQLDDFLATDPLGNRIKAGFDVVMSYRLNLAGTVLAATVVDQVTGEPTDLSTL